MARRGVDWWLTGDNGDADDNGDVDDDGDDAIWNGKSVRKYTVIYSYIVYLHTHTYIYI